MSQQWELREGEEVMAKLEAGRERGVVLTNLRVIISEGVGGAEIFTTIRLPDLQRAELEQEKASLLQLLLGLGVSVVGAPLIPQLISVLSEPDSVANRWWGLGLGALGIGLVVAGLIVVSGYLGRLLYPRGKLLFVGIPTLEIPLSSEAYRRAPVLIRHIQELKEA